MAEEIRIVPATELNAEQRAEFLVLRKAFAAHIRQLLEPEHPKEDTIIALSRETPVGYLTYEICGSELRVFVVLVKPGFERQGIARRLGLQAKENFLQKHPKGVVVWLGLKKRDRVEHAISGPAGKSILERFRKRRRRRK